MTLPPRISVTRQPFEMSSGVTDSNDEAVRLGRSFVCLLKLSTIPAHTIAAVCEVRTTPPPSSRRKGDATVFASDAIRVTAIKTRRRARHMWHTMSQNTSANV